LINHTGILRDNTGRTRLDPYLHRVILRSGRTFNSALEKQVYIQLLTASVSMKNMPSLDELGVLAGNESAEDVTSALNSLIRREVITVVNKPFCDGKEQGKIYRLNDIFSLER
jgi:hypothetical protein